MEPTHLSSPQQVRFQPWPMVRPSLRSLRRWKLLTCCPTLGVFDHGFSTRSSWQLEPREWHRMTSRDTGRCQLLSLWVICSTLFSPIKIIRPTLCNIEQVGIHVSALKSTPFKAHRGTAGHPQQHCSIAMAFRRLGLPLAGLEPARRPKVGSAPAKERAERAAQDPQEPKARVTLAVPATGAARRSLPKFVCFLKCGECLVQKWRIWSLGNKSGISAASLRMESE